MKAIVYTDYGAPNVLQLKEMPKPRPGENEILVKINATTVNYGEITARNFSNISPGDFNMPRPFWLAARVAFGLRKPKNGILGSEFSGEIEAVGKDVRRFIVGDEVFGYRGEQMGAYAEYLATPANDIVAVKPTNLSYEEAASLPYGALMALNLLRKAALQQGERILIIGASGGIGSFAVQLAKEAFGAEVTGVSSQAKVEYVQSLGADNVIDYSQDGAMHGGEQYDLILDILGRRSFTQSQRMLTPSGRHVFASFKAGALMQMLRTSVFSSKKAICALASPTVDDLLKIKGFVETGKLRPVVDRTFPLEKSDQAHKYYESGQACGKVVITV
ncbi:MAG: NAD(P)-dependent alcohol dehydrogenase [Chloroflexota bacterium]